MRPRIRFQYQELDLPLGTTVVGRDPDCHVTLDDPLVSRRHARILVGSDRVVVEDLDSRNGVLLNGIGILVAQTPLRDGDRLHIGTQCFLYCEVDEVPPSMPSRPTAELGLCAGCRLPYPLKAPACPMCGSCERLQPGHGPRPEALPERPSGVQARATPPYQVPADVMLPDLPRPPVGRRSRRSRWKKLLGELENEHRFEEQAAAHARPDLGGAATRQ